MCLREILKGEIQKQKSSRLRGTLITAILRFSPLLSVPVVAPTNINGGGGSRSELVITWEVIFYLSYFEGKRFIWPRRIKKSQKTYLIAIEYIKIHGMRESS